MLDLDPNANPDRGITRRVLGTLSIIAILGMPRTAHSVSVIELKDLGEALKAAADAIGKIGDSVAHIVELGTRGYDAASARLTDARLRDIQSRLVFLGVSQTALLDSLEAYINAWKTGTADRSLLEHSWQKIIMRISGILESVTSLLRALQSERGDFVLESAFRELVAVLQGRVSLLMRLAASQPPMTESEITGLGQVVFEYNRLRDNLARAIEAMAAYIKQLEKT